MGWGGLKLGLLVRAIAGRIEGMAIAGLPDGVMDRILEVLQPEEVWLFGSRARETHSPDSDWDVMAVLPDSVSDDRLDLGSLVGEQDLAVVRVRWLPTRDGGKNSVALPITAALR